ncbi:uncharacterized protein [Halyomorpha halys]|uniref:uncharacterized protein n=1 Tax=Halyomorpha halys TaxID=286706 RepID=UPI0006D4DE16|nr:uncharacterized protein LOC106692994 [Halyomorpha halys]
MYLRIRYVPRRYQHHVLLFLVSLTLVIVYHVQKELCRPRLEHLVIYKDHELGYRNPNVSCKFPILHPFDPSILSFVHLPNPVICYSNMKPYLLIDDEGYLRWNKTSLESDGYSTDGELYCTFQEIWRAENDDFRFIYGEQESFHGQDVKLNSDFVYTQCKNWLNLAVYQDFLAFAQKKKNIRTYKDGEFDVLVVGLDSVSRLNFMRQLPKAYRLLTGSLDATVLIGFNKVGHNTFPNVVPMLTGRPLLEPPRSPFKDWPFIWKDFARAGAATMYTEDLPDINMFDYLDDGIDEQPTHHYMHTFWLAVQSSAFSKTSARLCLGSKPKHDIHFSYIKSFLKTYSENPKFLFSLINEPTHDFANTAGVLDDVLTDFLNTSYQEGLFSRSVVFVLGDHGNRLDSIRSTEVGKIEDFMPMVAVIVPPSANPLWKQHLKMNSNRFTSTYDLYATFAEILSTLGGFPGKPGNTSERVYMHFSQPPRGVSLFKEIPLKRGCEDAAVPEWFCTCNNGIELKNTDIEARRAALAVVDHINDVLQNYTLCETLEVGEIKAAKLFKDSDDHTNLEITFYVNPSNALFQAGVKYTLDSHYIGNLERINRYGSQAACLGFEALSKNILLKSICYCKNN